MRIHLVIVLAGVALLSSACGDSSGPKAVPTSIEVTTQPASSASAGLPLATPPQFVVKDQDGNPMSGASVTIAVTAGGGTIAGAPTRTTTPATSVGTWTLGKSVGLNSLTITVGKLTPVVLSVTTVPGAPAKLVAVGSTTLTGVVGQPVASPISAVLKDAFDNGISGATVNVAVAGGGSVQDVAVTSDASGMVALLPSEWTLGTVKGNQTLTFSNGPASLTFTVAAAAGPIQSISVLTGNNQSGLAGTPLAQAVLLAGVDQYGNRTDNQVVNFSVLSGGGKLGAFTANAAPDGTITMPAFTLGKSALPQTILASAGSQSTTVSAAVISNYAIDVRFWGSAMTPQQQSLFTTAAARIRGVVTGAIPPADATGADPADCGVSGQPVLAESVPGVIIYASVQTIDGPGKILAQAGPCFIRDLPDERTVIGIMEFDVDDLGSLGTGSVLQDIITHEMLHVVGIGVFWNDKGLLTGFDTPDVAYTGTGGVTGCRATGGTTTCAASVPVENTGGSGTANSHWRETTFGAELMTGFASNGPMPFSIMTVRALEDIGYTINTAAADSYTIFAGSIRAAPSVSALTPVGSVWERGLASPPRRLPSHRRTSASGAR